MLNGDDRDIRNYLAWMGEVAEISDAMQAQRIEQIVQKQLDLMEACQSTYYPFDNLFCFMIKVIR
ncbi:MAG: hypothetical protein JST59_01760 [Actinobacteria bacterium]|nr:hypothetical protein [Actinomycetota bacterium]